MVVSKVKNLYDPETIKKCVQDIDLRLPESLKVHKMPQARKDLISKLIFLRTQKLITLFE